MTMCAYSEDYLSMAQKVLGDMLDFAVNTCDFDIDQFFAMFLVSDVSVQFQEGNPTYLVGKTGCELVREVIKDAGLADIALPDEMYLDKSPEYWTGWSLAYYQWYTMRAFSRIVNAVKISEILEMYPVYHEMDMMHFVERINELWDHYYVETNYREYRCGRSSFLNNVKEILTRQRHLICIVLQRHWDVEVRNFWKYKEAGALTLPLL